MNNAFVIKNFSTSYLYNTKITKGGIDNPGAVANKEIKNFIITAHRVDKNNDIAFRGFVEDIKREQTSAVLVSVLLDPRVVLCIGQAPLPRAFGVFEAKDSKAGGKPAVFIDLTGRVEFKDGYYVIRRGMGSQICALLFGALVYLLYRNYQNKLTNSSNLTYAATESYTAMFAYIIDYLRILGFAQNKSKICYAIALFFLTNLMNYDINDSYAKSVASKVAGLNAREASAYDLYIDDIDFTNINTFVTTLAATFNMRGFDLPTFISKWMYLYGVGTEYGTELYTSFLSMICTASIGCYIVQWSRIETCITSSNMAKISSAILKAGVDSLNTRIFTDQTEADKFAVHDKNTSDLAESMKFRNELNQMDVFVKVNEFANVDTAKSSAKHVISIADQAHLNNKLGVFGERSIDSGIEALYNNAIDLLEGKVSVDDSKYALGSLTEVAKIFSNSLDDRQLYRIESTIDRDVNHISEVVREADAPKEVNEAVMKSVLELRDLKAYI